MPVQDYHRVPGRTRFFTANLLQGQDNDLLVRRFHNLQAAIDKIRARQPFHVDGWVVLPNHMHCIWTLPPGDENSIDRWDAIKTLFTHGLPPPERRTRTRFLRGERGIWTRRIWEREIHDDQEYGAYLDYLHFDPVRHGYVQHVRDWPYSSFAQLVAQGAYPQDWAGRSLGDLAVGE